MYLLAKDTLFLQTETTKFCIGSLVIDIVLGSTNYKLRHPENRVLLDTFTINRIKLVFVSTPSTSRL